MDFTVWRGLAIGPSISYLKLFGNLTGPRSDPHRPSHQLSFLIGAKAEVKTQFTLSVTHY